MWGVVFGQRVAPLAGFYPTTQDFITHGAREARSVLYEEASVSLAGLRLLSPITSNQQFICQGLNYASHARESGLNPRAIKFNTLFTKASSCLTGADSDVLCPPHVKLLDYEVELGLVVGRDIASPARVGPRQLHDYLAGVTIVNDVSARDVQLPQGQFYKGKSYRSFGPCGPYLVLLDEAEWLRWPELHMELAVNDQVRQNAYCRDMIHAPHETLSELSALQNLRPGDLIATGTPAGCAVQAPGQLAAWLARWLLTEHAKWQMFVSAGRRNARYLKSNDVISATIRTDDGQIDLGLQRNRVVAGY
jgi:2-keto-4-pentenoate hydratase/2-oxohepta-3-ene-1,7-dioic acid hydratase in catechol pathway